MRAWACGERTIAAWWRPATGGWSSMYVPRPVRRRASSTRFTGLPIQRSALLIDPSLGQLDGVLVGLLPSRASLLVREDGLRSEEHTSELQSHHDLVCRLLLEKKKE